MSTAVRAGTDRDAFTSAAAGQAHGGKPPTAPSRRPHIVIIGAGFGGLFAATGLGRAAAVTVIDQRNHHLFQPLLYQVATAALSPAQVTGSRGPLPGVAPVAKQQGAYVARVIAARLAGTPPPGPFRYRDFGSLAMIPMGATVVNAG